jgi:hypothetical protein
MSDFEFAGDNVGCFSGRSVKTKNQLQSKCNFPPYYISMTDTPNYLRGIIFRCHVVALRLVSLDQAYALWKLKE